MKMILVLTIITLSLVNTWDKEGQGKCGQIWGDCGGGNECCSKFGFCGIMDVHCHMSKGCLPQYGACREENQHLDMENRDDLDNEEHMTKDGKCGPANGFCPKGQCCSKEGECGTTDDHCLVTRGCKSLFGNCKDDSDTFDDSTLPEEIIPQNRGSYINPGGKEMSRNFKNEKKIWSFLSEKLKNKYAVAGLMGCMYYYVRLNPSHMEDHCLRKVRMDEDTYTRKTNKGTYKGFVTDGCTYGLAVIRDPESKKRLLDFAKSKKKSIGSIKVQIEFFWEEFKSRVELYHPELLPELENIKSLSKAASLINRSYYTCMSVYNNKKIFKEVINNAAFYYNIYANKEIED
jgi:hypothetical protein